MISKEKKAAIIARVRKKSRRYRFTGGSDRNSDRKNRRAYRAFKDPIRRIIIPDAVCLKMVGQRRGLLDYLKKTDLEGYRALIEKLGIRK